MMEHFSKKKKNSKQSYCENVTDKIHINLDGLAHYIPGPHCTCSQSHHYSQEHNERNSTRLGQVQEKTPLSRDSVHRHVVVISRTARSVAIDRVHVKVTIKVVVS